MKVRRTRLIVLTALALGVAAIGTGVALGSGVGRSGSEPDGKVQAGRSAERGTLKCKAQACVNFDDNATMFPGTIKKVVGVGHPGTGVYCVGLVPSLHVTVNSLALTTVDWPDSPDNMIVAEWNWHTGDCAASGFPNAIRLDVFQDDAGTGATFANEAIVLTVP
jgi:hypothetical protein